LAHNGMSSKNSPLLVPSHCGHVIMLLTVWPKKAKFFFGLGVRSKILAGHSASDCLRKETVWYCKIVSCKNDATVVHVSSDL
jgi:hypothetical protein